MAKDGPMKNRVIRMDDATWADYGEYCDEIGISRSDEFRMHVRAVLDEWRRKKRRDAKG